MLEPEQLRFLRSISVRVALVHAVIEKDLAQWTVYGPIVRVDRIVWVISVQALACLIECRTAPTGSVL